MAESAGLVLGALALAGVFKDCIDLFSYFSTTKSFSRDFELLATKLDVEKLVLLQWAERVRLLREDYDRRLDVQSIQKAVAQILASINLLLSDASELKTKYGVKETASTEITKLDVPISANRLESFISEFRGMNLRLARPRPDVPTRRKLYWAIHDKEKFDRLIEQLSHFTFRLFLLVPDHGEGTTRMRKDDIESLTPDNLRLMRCALPSNHVELSDVVEQQWRRLMEDRVLQCLWFRSMDNRKAGVAPKHAETFEWALQSQADLLNWFRSGDGIYWVSGKAASGKSTLMKFLFNDYRAGQLLGEWAGDMNLKMGSFFLWNVGMEEQKSQAGLARALLYHVLHANPSMIQAVLPGLWREVEKRSASSSSPALPSSPSKEEVRQAFELLQGYSIDRIKYCLFVDGLDELADDHMEAIALIQSLAALSNIKIIVSSRPIASCETAFSSGPSLRLQDLTKRDIRMYVEDHITNHPRWQIIATNEQNSTGAGNLMSGIVEKASGVFLWVVLACKSVKEGLSNFDSIKELQDRIQELPPELEQLFAQMLSRIEPKYQEEAARLLSLAYHHQRVGQRRSLCNFELSLANQIGAGSRRPTVETVSVPEMSSSMIVIEGRLRSRCLGLLEVNIYPSEHAHCPAAAHSNSSHKSIDFMHRTVFDFLDSPEARSLACLQKHYDSFDAFSVLAWTTLDLYYLVFAQNLHFSDTYGFEHTAHLVKCLRMVKRSSFETVLALLRTLEDMADRFCAAHPEGTLLSRVKSLAQNLQTSSNGSISLIPVALAVEAGMPAFVECFISTFQVNSSALNGTTLLRDHAMCPTLWDSALWEYDSHPRLEILAILLEAGCDPNKIHSWQLSLTSAFEHWMFAEQDHLEVLRRNFKHMTKEETEAWKKACPDCLKGTELFVDAGADLNHLDKVFEEPAESALQRIAPKSPYRREIDALCIAIRRRRAEMPYQSYSSRKGSEESSSEDEADEARYAKRRRLG